MRSKSSARPFSAKLRPGVLEECARAPADLVVVGGGITGSGILRDAAMRGLRALLIEREDFASGTSSRSSKLIHGGLRYLETLDWKLVFEASAERRTLLQTAPSLVRPLPFLYPIYRNHRRGLLMVAAGVWLYDFLSLFRSVGHPRLHLRRTTTLLEPGLRKRGLVGSALYFDAVTHDAHLALATLASGWDAGGLAVNHAEVAGILRANGAAVGVKVRDLLDGKTYDVRCRWIVNATGPWSDRFAEEHAPVAPPHLRLTKGVHLVIERRRLPIRHAVLMIAPSDGRVTFLIPWESAVLVGTTDTDFAGDPSKVSADAADVAYLLDTANFYYPEARLVPADVAATFAGLRPLLRDESDRPSNVSREHAILFGPPGIVSLAGGKYTTYRKMAAQLLDELIDRTPEWRAKVFPCTTDRTPIDWSPPSPEKSAEAQAERWIESTMAATVGDLLERRTSSTLLAADHGRSKADLVARVLARQLGYPPEKLREQLIRYEEAVRNARAGLDS